jgi:hypothetical protein
MHFWRETDILLYANVLEPHAALIAADGMKWSRKKTRTISNDAGLQVANVVRTWHYNPAAILLRMISWITCQGFKNLGSFKMQCFRDRRSKVTGLRLDIPPHYSIINQQRNEEKSAVLALRCCQYYGVTFTI